MPTKLFERCAAHIRATEAADLGCAVADFDSHRFVAVPRPEKVRYPEYVATVVTFGTGTVCSVEAPYLEWVNANPPKKHYAAIGAQFLSSLSAEIGRLGVACFPRGNGLGFALAEEPSPPGAPAGFRLEHMGLEWMEEWRPRAEFHNALGDPDEDDWFGRLAQAFVIFDESGEAAAAAAVGDDGNGSMEIGLDVRSAYRGIRLARPVVLEAARWVLDQGQVPYYTCGAGNVRSHLVAESCGFRALWTASGVARITQGVGDQSSG